MPQDDLRVKPSTDFQPEESAVGGGETYAGARSISAASRSVHAFIHAVDR